MGYWALAFAQAIVLFPILENMFLACRFGRIAGHRRSEMQEATEGYYRLPAGGRWGSCPTLPYGELRLSLYSLFAI
jgi:hypothetical protein